ncbi:ESPR domain-containing protein [Halomonas colorata]|uniref:ESPR domain-containing protein n=1 Tax=Halomonas colorata TaxID=2742615 RepID=UPI001868CBB8
MNKVFRLIWSRTLGRLVVASEAARSHDKSATQSTRMSQSVITTQSSSLYKLSSLAAVVAIVSLTASHQALAVRFSDGAASDTTYLGFMSGDSAPLAGDSSVNNCFTTDADNDLWSCLGQTSGGGIFFLSGFDDPQETRFDNAPAQGAIAIGSGASAHNTNAMIWALRQLLLARRTLALAMLILFQITARALLVVTIR